jgi:drug/metabolite transporter (DMT)-like permease
LESRDADRRGIDPPAARRDKGAPAMGESALKGPALMLAGIGLYNLLDANSKLLSASYPMPQVVGMRYAAILAALLLVAPWLDAARLWRRENAPAHALRCVSAMAASAGFFLAFRSLPLAEGYLVFFLAPFLTLVLNATWLGERIAPAAWGWSVLGFAGVAVALAPNIGAGGAVAGYLYAVMGALGHAVQLTVNRRLRHEDGVARLLLFPSLTGVLVLLPFGVAEWRPTPALDFALLASNGLLFGAATVCVAVAFRHAPAARLVPFEFTILFWAVALDAAIWGIWPAPTTLIGGVLVVLACLMSERAAHRPAAAPGRAV